ncbi:MAG TPA: CHRD domain-containing protein [Nitrososphaeraceae archaeon]
MIGKGYLSILFIVTAIVMLSNINVNANAQIAGTFSADLKPTVGSNSHATGKTTLELQDNGQTVKYDVSASGLGNVSGVVISQEMGSGRAPDVVSLKQASTSGLKSGSGSATGTFTKSDLIGPLQGKVIADFVKAINDGKIVFRIMTTTYPLGEILGTVTVGAGNATASAGNATGTAMNATANAAGTALNATANATGKAIGEAKYILKTAANATANATGEVMTKANSVLNLAASSGANATQTAMNQAKDIMTNVTNNVSSIATNASRAVLAEANNLINTASNTTTNATNATGTTMTPESVSTPSNATATTNATNATGTTITPESVSTPSNATATTNVTTTATKGNETGNPILDALKSIFGGITGK